MKRLAMLPGAWQRLFGHAMRLIDDIGAHHIRDPVWTFGGGTVLMLRHGHRAARMWTCSCPTRSISATSPRA